jgi:hypothetical protein
MGMSTIRDVAAQAGTLCVGTTAYALGDPSGGQLAATALTGLAAIGLTLKAGCAHKACASAEAQVIKAVEASPEFSKADLLRARDLLSGKTPTTQIDPKSLSRFAASPDFDTAVADFLLQSLMLADDDPLYPVLRVALRAGLAAAKKDAEFRAALTLELVIDAGRQNGLVLAKVTELNTKMDELLRRFGDFGTAMADPEALSLPDLRTLAERFGGADIQGKAALVEFLTLKAQDMQRLIGEIAAMRGLSDRIDNIRAAAIDALQNDRMDEARALLNDARTIQADLLRAPLEANAGLLERLASIDLIENKVEQAYRLLSAAADSFAGVDPLEPARRRNDYMQRLYSHGLRYGGPGLALSALMTRDALADLPQATEPALWARLHNSLAVALRNQGSRTAGAAGAALLGQAVEACRAALEVYTRVDHPVDWAMTTQNLANALADQGSRTEGAAGAVLLGQAVEACRAALEVYTRADHPVDWAMTTQNLANALAEQGSRTEGAAGAALLGQAVEAYREALEVYTRADHPVDWAMTTQNLAGALQEQGSRTGGAAGAALLGQAVEAYRKALEVRTRADHPVPWAMTRENMALLEQARAAHDTCTDPAPHLRAALDHVTAALTVYDPDHMPYDHGTATRLRDDLLAQLAAL